MDICNVYVEDLAKATIRAMALSEGFALIYQGLPRPEGLHFKRGGEADKRYKNWEEAEKWRKEYNAQYKKDLKNYMQRIDL